MGRISRRHLNGALEERIHEVFWQHLARLNSTVLVREFLQSLLSHTEQVMIAKRIAIAILLSRGYTYEYIDETLKVSRSTISIVHRQMLTGAPGYERAILEANKKSKRDSVWDSLEEVLLKISLPARVGSFQYQIKSASGKQIRKHKYQREQLV